MRMNVFEYICKYLRRNAFGTEVSIARVCDVVSSYAESRGKSINEGTTKVYLSILKKAGYLAKSRKGYYRIAKMPEDDLTYSVARWQLTERVFSEDRQARREQERADESIRERLRREFRRERERAEAERQAIEESARNESGVRERLRRERQAMGINSDNDIWSTEEVWDAEKIIESELENITDGKRKAAGSFFFEEDEFEI